MVALLQDVARKNKRARGEVVSEDELPSTEEDEDENMNSEEETDQ